MAEPEQEQLSDEQWARLALRTGCDRAQLRLVLQRMQRDPEFTRAQQLAWIGRLTRRSPEDLAQAARAVRQRRQDVALRPCLVRLLARLRRLREAPDARFVTQCRMPLEQALRLVVLLERQHEPDGYVYTATLQMMDPGALRHQLSVSWRHPSHEPELRCAELFGEADF